MTNDLQAISLFSGAGGMDIGIEDAGFNILAQLEMDEHCCTTLKAARERSGRSTRIFETNICDVDVRAVRKDLGLSRGDLDPLFGGPPCQSFSLAGKRLGLKDERGLLLFQIIRFAREFQPKTILVEQVKGLLSSKGPRQKRGEVFSSFLSELKDVGYFATWKVVCAADFGVPQLRERLFVVAERDRNGFVFPDRTHAPKHDAMSLFPMKSHIGVGEVISDLGPPACKIRGTTFHPREDGHVDVTPDRDRERIAQVPEGSYLAAQMHLDKRLIRGLTKKDTTKFLRLHRNRPANTLRCGEIFYHPRETDISRRAGIHENSWLSGFIHSQRTHQEQDGVCQELGPTSASRQFGPTTSSQSTCYSNS